jgi:hypothetical protein
MLKHRKHGMVELTGWLIVTQFSQMPGQSKVNPVRAWFVM